MTGPPSPIYDAIPYDIKYDALFVQEFARIEPDDDRRKRRLGGIEFVISRIPTAFSQIGDSNIYRMVHDGKPAVRVWYTFDGTVVTFRLIQELDVQLNG